MMSLSNREIKEILAILEESGWDEAEVTIGDVTVSVSKGSAPAGPAPAAPQARPSGSPPAAQVPDSVPPEPAPSTAATPPGPPTGHAVASPSVGVFWRSPEPGATPFVDVGTAVEAGQTLCIVEVMKLMQHVNADVAGTITAVLVENGDNVEFGTPLFSIEPAA
jgi:acetyl-CoA carboxylase biotin carboxyl carrier protein